MLSLTNLLASYVISPGDTVFIDTGSYSNYSVTISSADAGAGGTNVIFQGSTNFAAGGSVFRNTATQDMFVLNNISNVTFRHLTARSSLTGFRVSGQRINFESVYVVSNQSGFFGGGSNIFMRQCLALGNTRAVWLFDQSSWFWDGGVFWSNAAVARVDFSFYRLSISNSALVGGSLYVPLGSAGTVPPPAGDYNVLWSIGLGGTYVSIYDLQRIVTNSWRFSTWADPLFANAPADFHERSLVGTYTNGAFVTYTNHSPLIDFSPASSSFAQEPQPNGTNRNAGLYGDSAEAAKSLTNAWLLATSLNDGGEVTGLVTLAWAGGNFTNGATVRVEYSPDNGASWALISNGVPVTNRLVSWNVAAITSTPVALWRVSGESAAFASIADTNHQFFTVRGIGSRSFFVNDASVTGDVYCSASGSATNSGLSAATPALTLQQVLDTYDLAPGDTVFVDTGRFVSQTVTFAVQDQGSGTNLVVIAGSSNLQSGGTVFDRQNSTQDVFVLNNSGGFLLRDLSLVRGRYGLYLQGASCRVENVVSASNQVGFYGYGTNHAFRRCQALYNALNGQSYGAYCVQGQTPWTWENCLFASNLYAVRHQTLLDRGTFSNCVFVGGTFNEPGVDPPRGDYCVFWSTAFSLLGAPASLSDLQKYLGAWKRSTVANPFFVSATDFHEQSPGGTYSNGLFVLYSNRSAAIDFGDPAMAVGAESAPNGGRINAGPYGGTAEASRSDTNAWLMALSYRDGGTLSTPSDVVYWNAGGLPTGATVRIEFSGDDGGNWSVVTTGLLASAGQYTWSDTNYTSSRFARWRIVLESNTNVMDATPTNFVFRNGAFVYYINDSSTAGDVYTTGPGSDLNLGTAPTSPKYSLQSLLNVHALQAGDMIFIDTGNYVLSSNQTISSLDAGTTNGFVSLIGSTNLAAGGTVFNRGSASSSSYALEINGASYISVSDLTLRNAGIGLRVNNSASTRFQRVRVEDTFTDGIQCLGSTADFDQLVARRNTSRGLYVNGGTVSVRRAVFYRNATAALRVDGGTATISNSVIHAAGGAAYGYYAAATNSILGDFNAFHVESNAVVGFIASLGRNADALGSWSALTGVERCSMETDPLFADAPSGDFHLRTQTPLGRPLPFGAGFTNDTVTSPLIDAAAPASSFGNEPSPNGRRADMGYFGNTAEASIGRTNGWIFASTLRNGGFVATSGSVHWVAGGGATAGTVTVEWSPTGGKTWSSLASGIPASLEKISWSVSGVSNTPAALWRVRHDTQTNAADAVTNFFAVRNSPLVLFVNDTSTVGDCYAAAPGAATNYTASFDAPVDSLAATFRLYDLEPGDSVFVDAGIFTNVDTVTIGRYDGGSTALAVSVIGSTNASATSSVLYNRDTNAYVVLASGVQGIVLSNLVLRGAGAGFRANGVSGMQLGRIRAVDNAGNGFESGGSDLLTFRRCVAARNGSRGLDSSSSTSVVVEQSILWSNNLGAVLVTAGSLSISNSVLNVAATNRYVFDLQSAAILRGDFNDVLVAGGGRVGRVNAGTYPDLKAWQDLTGQELRSLSHDPLFADAAGDDFHLRSSAGRPLSNGGLTNDALSSPLIDTAASTATFANEPVPNGGRMDIGLYGNDAEASRSRTNAWLLALSLNGGGVARSTNTLYWVAGGAATGLAVHVQYSADGGGTWTNIATNIAASVGVYVWDSSSNGSSAISVWRVVLAIDSNNFDATDSSFILNNGSLTYYVNDAATNGDVYTSAPGSAGNTGTAPGSPKATVQDVVDTYALGPGDRILVDTGVYSLPQALAFSDLDTGSTTNPLIVRGSTNYAAGGTVLDRQSGGYAARIENSAGVWLQHLRITNASPAVLFSQTTNSGLEFVSIDGGVYGAEIFFSPGVTIRQSSIRGCSRAVYQRTALSAVVEHSVLWSNTVGVFADAGAVTVSNSVIGALNPNQSVYNLSSVATIVADYNDLFLTNGAWVATRSLSPRALTYETVSRWARDYGQDRHSLSHDPLFASADAGDFHLRSRAFRFTNAGSITNDPETSPLVDAGAPTAAFTNEPSPNGSRVNIGVYGNDSRGSASPSNASLVVVSLNDGGRAEGQVALSWVAAGAATGHSLRVEYSADDGFNWITLTSGIPASAGSYLWNSTQQVSSLFARWRISSMSESNVFATSRTNFALRNSGFNFFVNDGAVTGDVYVTQAGDVTNSGLSASQPAASLQQIVDAYDLEAGDSIYIDTGEYGPTGTVVIAGQDGGNASNRVSIYGSTNSAAGGTVFTNRGLEANAVDGLLLRDVTVRGASKAIRLISAGQCVIEHVSAVDSTTGFEVDASGSIQFSNCVARNAGGQGLLLQNSPSSVSWSSGILWSNTYGIRMESGSLTVRNSVLGAWGAGRAAIYYNAGSINSDYNDFHLLQGAVATYRPTAPLPTVYQTLSRWTRDFGADVHSLSHDPMFANAAGADFHPKSTAGRWVAGQGYTNDAVSSPIIDAGDPSSSCSAEPMPNGGRIDLGSYGNDEQASLSPTNSTLLALSLNDGGRAENTVNLNWFARGAVTGHTVRLEYSPDAGQSWTTIVAGISASAGNYAWNTTSFVSSARGVWRVVSENDGTVGDQSDVSFALRNSPLSFFVNDAATTGDVYCTVAGSAANDGTSVSAPKSSVQDIIDTYDLEPGDVVFIDTGTYLLGADISVGMFDSGSGTNCVSFIGSTNTSAGGSIFDRQGGSYGIRIEQAPSVAWQNVRILNAGIGVRFQQSDSGILDGLEVRGGAQGVEINDADNVVMRHCIIRQCSNFGVQVSASTGGIIDNCALWSNSYAISMNSGSLAVSNSAISVFGANHYAYYFAAGGVGQLSADYNNLFHTNNGYVAFVPTIPATIFQSASRWARDTGRDVHSLSHDPGFAAPGAGDFHLVSTAGRFVPGAGLTNDLNFSPLLDAGAPYASYAREQTPNGGRLDIGRYGNHPESSLSSTSPSLTVVSLNDGGRVEGTNSIYWIARGAATGHTLRLEFSPDNGASWMPIAMGVAAQTDGYVWNTTLFPNTVLGRWRVLDEAATNVSDVSDTLFDLRNGPISFYVNDGSTAGDVYVSTVGLATNVGISPATPKTSIQDVLDTYDLEPGDTIYVDTGNYTLTAPITVGQFDAGAPSNRVTIQGSTNIVGGGSVLNRFGGDRCFNISSADGIALRHLTLRNATTAAIRWFDSDYGLLEWVRAESSLLGFDVDGSQVVTMRHCVARSCATRGINARASTVTWRNGVIWSNGVGAYLDGGTLSVSNSILGGFQAGSSAFFVNSGVLASDYNGFFVTNGAAIATALGGVAGGGTSRYVNLGSWFAGTGRDGHSLSAEPRFANAGSGDFHLRSQAGRYLPGTGFVLDADSSPFIDAGDPLQAATAEPAPNGGRVNVGVFGDSAEASKTPTNSSLQAVSYNDGGGASGAIELYWVATGNAASHTLRLEYSSDGGMTFTNIAVGLPAASGSYTWDSSGFGSSPVAVWRVTSEVETNASDRSDVPFYLRNGGGITYFVNDAATAGDVYCTAIGAATNSGHSAASPLHSIQAVLDSYDLEPGDRVLVDTGDFNISSDITVGDLDAGVATNAVTIQGSTNSAAGGTVINRQILATNASAFLLQQTAGIHLRNLRLLNAGQGIRIEQSPSCRMSDLRIEGAGGAGIRINNAAGTMVSNCLVMGSGAGIYAQQAVGLGLRHSMVWNSGTALELSQGSSASVGQCILQASGLGARVYKVALGSSVTGDYNDLLRTNGAYLAEQGLTIGGSDIYQTLTAWTIGRTQEVHSFAHEPRFGNPAGGDFHLQSSRGRYVPGSGYVVDAVDSVLLDAGDPVASFANEALPNGGRVDLGIYGNRGESSLSRTGAWITAISFNDGGTLAATNQLFWSAGNLPSNALLTFEYSLNNGISWSQLASNIPATNASLTWDVTSLSATILGLWRLSLASDTGVTDSVDTPFVIRTAAIDYYVNDASTTGDVFCTAPGSLTNAGGSASTPVASIQQVLDSYPLSAGDVIHVDTGVYLLTNALTLNELVRGETGFPIRIEGSSNVLAGGTVLQLVPGSSSSVLRLSQTRHLDVSRLTLSGGSVGLSVQNAEQCTFSWLDVQSNASHGIVCATASPLAFEHCLVRGNSGYGLEISGASSVSWRHGLLWSNSAGPVHIEAGSMLAENSIFHASAASNAIFTLGQSGTLSSDFNMFWRPMGGVIGRNTFLAQSYANLAEWSSLSGQDAHSILGDPRFAAPASGDFHVQSTGGRFSNGVFVADAQTSYAVDGGNPLSAYPLESLPNGARANIGLYGNSIEASRTPSTPQLVALSLADGGTVRGPYSLNWLAQGFSATSTVSLYFSADAGGTWTNVVQGLSAGSGTHTWDPAGYPSSPASRWRVVSDENTNLYAATSSNFFLRTGSVIFYVNDAATNGDIYTTATGSLTNLGLSPSGPLPSLGDVLAAYDLDGGDAILIDTGSYTSGTDTVIGSLDSGVATAAVFIVGSTNWMAGGTLLDRGDADLGTSIALSFSGAQFVNVQNLTVQRAGTLLQILQSTGIAASNLLLRNGGAAGMRLDQASGVRFANSVITRVAGVGVLSTLSAGNTLDHAIVWSNGSHAVSVTQGDIAVTNSVLHARGAGRLCYASTSNGVFYSDHNDLYPEAGAAFGPDLSGLTMESLPQWSQSRVLDSHSLSVDPLFADAASDDYHVRSLTGRFVPALGTFVADTNHSYLIDTGDEHAPVELEPSPNGGHVNIGIHGTRTEASMSRTNAWILALTASSGGRLSGSVFLDWAWGGMSETNTLRLDYSYDDGVSWTNITSGLAITMDDFPWDSAQQVSNVDVFVSSPIGRWRVTVEADTNIMDVTDSHFALRNSPFVYYVNDTSTVGDVYTTAIGSDTNLGLFPYAPKATLESLLGSLDVEGSDVIEIDTGVYNLTNSFGVLTAVDSGTDGFDVLIRGSTNGTRLNRLSGPTTVLGINGPNVHLRDLSISGGSLVISASAVDASGIAITNGGATITGASATMTNMTFVASPVTVSSTSNFVFRESLLRNSGITLMDCKNAVLQNLTIHGSATAGLNVQGASTPVTVRNCTLAVSGHQFQMSGSSTVTLENNILIADGAGRFCLLPEGGILSSDYNNLVARNGAWIGARNGFWEKLTYWQRESGQDMRSLSHEPLFANEGAGDFHLKSVTGRYTGGVFVADAVHSPSIDAGNPLADIGLESAPNGSRIDQGSFGGLAQASRSRTNEWLVAMTANDGGVLRGTNSLRWAAGNIAATNTVSLQYSTNGGVAWITIASGIGVTNGIYSWATPNTNSLSAFWRIVRDGATNVQDGTDVSFSLRNAPLFFYVNNTQTVNDVFTTAIGNATNSGLTASAPKDSLASLLAAYDTEGGDTIFMDTGTYTATGDVLVIWSRGGDAANGPLIIRGSTNLAAGGTIVSRGNTNSGIGLDVRASYVTLRDFAVRDASRGIQVYSNVNVRLERLLIYSNDVGVTVTQALNATVVNSRFWNNRQGGVDVSGSSTSVVEHCTLVGNVPFSARFQSSANSIFQNNIIYVTGSNAVAALSGSAMDIFIDYNIYYFETNAMIWGTNADLVGWQLSAGHDYRSALTNPALANVSAGDFHERSIAGRYVDGTGFVADTVNSWALDHGNPSSVYSNEPAVNGGRANIGAYGNTAFAGKGSTNALVELRVLNDGTQISETNSVWPLTWTALNVPTNEQFRIQFSGNGGTNWVDLQTGVTPYGEVFVWQTTPSYNTYHGRWRVVGVNNSNLVDVSDALFQIFHGEFAISSQTTATNGFSQIVWRGAWGENYRVQYATNAVGTNAWFNGPSGPATNQIAVFFSTNGGDFVYQDIGSATNRQRLYRVVRDPY